MIRKMCARPGCTASAEGRRCAAHAASAPSLYEGERRKASLEWRRLYRTARWRKMRKAFLEAHPLCAMCGAPATEADHVIPHRGDEALFFDCGNLQGLCKSCHSAKTLRENGNFNGRGKR